MAYAVELFFDSAGDSRVREIWRELAGSGIPSLHGSESRPHVSLAVSDDLDLEAARRLLDEFARENAAFPLSFSSIGRFPGAEPVIFLAPKLSAVLQALQERFHARFAAVARDLWLYYEPLHWTPHCTLVSACPGAQVAAAIERASAAGLPFECRVIEIGLVEFRPVRLIHRAVLALGEEPS